LAIFKDISGKTTTYKSVNENDALTLPVDASAQKASTGGNSEIAQRLKAARVSLNLKQDVLASQSGVSYSVYQKYEKGSSVPGGEAIAGFMKAGISANWLLTGEGPMLLRELAAPAPAPAAPRINVKALAAILDGAQRGLVGASPLKVAEFAVNMYIDAINRGLITPDGVGDGHAGKAA